MTVGTFLNVTNYRQFELIGREIMQMPDMDPALVFQTAVPGFLGELFQPVGPWQDRQQKAFEFPSKNGQAKAVAANERAVRGGYDKKQIVALPGFEIAGETQTVLPSDFLYGGMTRDEVTRRAMRPRLDWNKATYLAAMDVVSAKGKSTGAPVDNGAYVVNDFHGNSTTKALATNSADVCSDTIANSSQSILFPLRDGTEAAANHDHTLGSNAAWTLATQRTNRDLVLEHPGNGAQVNVIAGATAAAAIRTALASALNVAGITSGEALLRAPLSNAGSLASAVPIARGWEGMDFYFAPDMDTNQVITVAAGKKPFYFSQGAKGVDGSAVGTGAWFEQENVETRGGSYGYRDYLNLGCMDPTAVVIADHV